MIDCIMLSDKICFVHTKEINIIKTVLSRYHSLEANMLCIKRDMSQLLNFRIETNELELISCRDLSVKLY